MLLSVHEGFGLTAWEAIGAAVPLILSKNSGVYEFLASVLGGPAVGCVHTIDIKASHNPGSPSEEDIEAVAERIAHIAKDPSASRLDARRLLAQLKSYTWDNLAKTILDSAALQLKTLAAPEATTPASAGADPLTPDVSPDAALFDVYEPRFYPYYVTRPLDDDLRLHRGRHIWLWGKAGTGKTTSLRHDLMAQPNYVYISLSACIGQDVRYVFEHIFFELSERLGSSVSRTGPVSLKDSIQRIQKLLSEITTLDVHVHLDELPIDDPDGQREFCQSFIALLIAQTATAPAQRARYAISTIDDPTPFIGPSQSKVRERLSILRLEQWSADELQALLDVTSSTLSIPLIPQQRETLVRSSRGSPRFIKLCIRKLRTFGTAARWSFERIVSETAAELSQ